MAVACTPYVVAVSGCRKNSVLAFLEGEGAVLLRNDARYLHCDTGQNAIRLFVYSMVVECSWVEVSQNIKFSYPPIG